MELAVFAFPVLLLLPIGLLVGAALTHYLNVRIPLGLAVALGLGSGVMVVMARAQPEQEAIGTRVLALAVLAPAAVGLALGAWLAWRGRTR